MRLTLGKYIVTSLFFLTIVVVLFPVGLFLKSLLPILGVFTVVYLSVTRLINKNKTITAGLIIFMLFFVYMFFGILNYFTVKIVFPEYTEGIENTALYWLFIVVSFTLGYFSINKNKNKDINNVYFPNKSLLFILFILAFIFTIYAFSNIGFIPSFKKGAGGEDTRYFTYFGFLGVKMWELFLPIGLISIEEFVLISKRKIYLFVFILSAFFLMAFVVRFHIMLLLLASFILLYSGKKVTKRFFIYFAAGLVFYFIFNANFIKYRTGNEIYLWRKSNLPALYSEYIFSSFNEFRQLNQVVNTYKDFQYGETLLILPISLFPTQFWSAMGIVKEDIQRNNSALLTMKYLKRTTGIRTGLSGEFFINFGYWGALLFYFVGILVAYLDKKIVLYRIGDFRKVFISIVSAILVYSIFIGQIDVVSSQIVLAVYFYFIFFIFKKSYQIGLR